MALTQTQVSELYVSVFGRASEGEGNTYWQTNQVDQVTTAKVMLETDAAKDYFGDTLNDNQKFVEHIYKNTLGKTYAEDKDGVDYWVAELASGKTKAEVVSAMINAATATENAGDAQDQFNNKVAVSNYAADTISKFTTISAFAAFIDDVDNTDASVTTAKGEVDTAKEAGDQDDAGDIQGSTYQLTDSRVGTGAADNVQGTAGDDTINGATGTLESIDVVNGAAGDDVLTARLDDTDIAPVVSNVETINLLTRGTAGSGSLNFADVTGYTTLNVSGTDDYTFAAIPNNFEVTLHDIDDEEMTFVPDNATGSADVFTANLKNTAGSAKLTLEADIETLNLKSTGDAANTLFLDTDSDNTTEGDFDVVNGKIVVTGDQDFTLGFGDNDGPGTGDTYSDVVIDASTFEKTFTILNADTTELEAKNFSGVDVFAFNSRFGATYEVVNAESTTAVAISLAETGVRETITVDYDMKDAEKISSKTDSLGVKIAMDDSSDADDFAVNLTTNGIETVSVTADGATDADSTLTLTLGDDGMQSLTVDGTSLANIDSLTLAGGAFATSKLTAIDFSAAGADTTMVLTSAASIGATDSVEISGGSGDDTITYNSTGIAVIDSGAGADTVTTGAQADQIETGAGDDSVTANAGADTIESGAGDDTITAGAGIDQITTGTGTDSVVVATTEAGLGTAETFSNFVNKDAAMVGALAAGDTITGAEVITDIAAGDTLTLGNANLAAFDATAAGQVTDNEVTIVQGTYSGGIFTVGTGLNTGADSLVLWDSDAGATLEIEAIVLQGVVTAEEGAVAGGVITFA